MQQTQVSRGLSASLRIACCSLVLAIPAGAWAQAVIFTPEAPVDRRYAQIESTNVSLPTAAIDARGHQEILRNLESEQGFAMRPLPRGKKGLTLMANGKMTPSGQSYMTMVSEQGLSVKPGDRVILSDIRIERDKIVFDINGGPEHKHEFLRHIQIGVGGPGMTGPVVQDPDGDHEPTGARITLAFAHEVPDVTPAQIKKLLAPLISFDVKTPVQAYTDTLPPALKKAILEHRILVGMNTDMVLFTLGQPEKKSREIEGQMPFEEWIYGHPPQDVNFVRINGNRVIRVEVAKLGQPLEVYTQDVVSAMLTTDGLPVLAAAETHEIHPVELGDVHRDAATQAPAAPPSLRNPGEKLPSDDPKSTMNNSREGPMRPVVFPKDTTNDPAHTTSAAPVKTDAAKADPAKTDSGKPDSQKAEPVGEKPAEEKPEVKPEAPAATPNGGSYFYAPIPAAR
jgi:hypothetical protein